MWRGVMQVLLIVILARYFNNEQNLFRMVAKFLWLDVTKWQNAGI